VSKLNEKPQGRSEAEPEFQWEFNWRSKLPRRNVASYAAYAAYHEVYGRAGPVADSALEAEIGHWSNEVIEGFQVTKHEKARTES